MEYTKIHARGAWIYKPYHNPWLDFVEWTQRFYGYVYIWRVLIYFGAIDDLAYWYHHKHLPRERN